MLCEGTEMQEGESKQLDALSVLRFTHQKIRVAVVQQSTTNVVLSARVWGTLGIEELGA